MKRAASGLGPDCPHPGPLQSWSHAQVSHSQPHTTPSPGQGKLTRPGGVQPVLYMQDLFILGPAICLFTDPVIFGDFLLKLG